MRYIGLLLCLFTVGAECMWMSPPDYSYEGICRKVQYWKFPSEARMLREYPERIWPTRYFVTQHVRTEHNAAEDLRFALANLMFLFRNKRPLLMFQSSPKYLACVIEIDGERYNILDLIVVKVINLQGIKQRMEDDIALARQEGNEGVVRIIKENVEIIESLQHEYVVAISPMVDLGMTPVHEGYTPQAYEAVMLFCEMLRALAEGWTTDCKIIAKKLMQHDVALEYHGKRFSVREMCEYLFVMAIEEIDRAMRSILSRRIEGSHTPMCECCSTATYDERMLEHYRNVVEWWATDEQASQ